MTFNITIAIILRVFFPGLTLFSFSFLFINAETVLDITVKYKLVIIIGIIVTGIITEVISRQIIVLLIILKRKKYPVEWIFKKLTNIVAKYFSYPEKKYKINRKAHYLCYGKMDENLFKFLAPTLYKPQGFFSISFISLLVMGVFVLYHLGIVIETSSYQPEIILALIPLLVSLTTYYMSVYSMRNLYQLHKIVFDDFYYSNQKSLDRLKTKKDNVLF